MYERLNDVVDVQNEENENEQNHKCEMCGSMFQTISALETHQKNGHGQKIDKMRWDEKYQNITDISLQAELDMEKKSHIGTKKCVAALEKEYKSCREKFKIVQEEKERYKIKS